MTIHNTTILSVSQVVDICRQAGFTGLGLVNAVAVALAEANWNTGRNNGAGNDPPTSVDRGLFQINSYWHPEVTDAQTMDPLENAKAAYRISAGGLNWGQWTTWATGKAQSLVATATAAIAAGGGGGSSGGGNDTGDNPIPPPSTPADTGPLGIIQAYIAQAKATIDAANKQSQDILSASTSLGDSLGGLGTVASSAVASLTRLVYVIIGLALALVGLWLVVKAGG